MPSAHADILDLIIDPVIGSLTSVADVGGAAASFGGDLGDVGGAAASAAPSDALAGVDSTLVDMVSALNNAVQGATQSYITSPVGEGLYPVINQPTVLLFGRDLIGNAVNGFTGPNDSPLGSSGLFGNLGDGGFVFGDGGNGAAGTAGVDDGAGWAGGSAGFVGDGGAGGAGVGEAAVGAGGSGGWLLGDGGMGGAGGAAQFLGNGGAGGVGGSGVADWGGGSGGARGGRPIGSSVTVGAVAPLASVALSSRVSAPPAEPVETPVHLVSAAAAEPVRSAE